MTYIHKVSVVIPTYNRAVMLRTALDSVIAQTLPTHEIVVVDDGSTDDTPEMIRELQANGAPIIYLRELHANRRGFLRNKGAQTGSGDLIAFLDSDDLWKPQRLKLQLEAFERTPEAGFAFCKLQRFDENGPIDVPHPPSNADYNGHILGELLEEPLVVPSTLLVKRDVFMSVGGFADLPINEEFVLMLHLAARYTASYIPDTLVLMREHPGRISHTAHETSLLSYLGIVEQFVRSHPELPPGTLAHARRGRANVHLKLARLYLACGDSSRARKHLLALFKLQPWDRRILEPYLRSWLSAKQKSEVRNQKSESGD